MRSSGQFRSAEHAALEGFQVVHGAFEGPDDHSVLIPKTTASRSVISPAAKEARPHCWSARHLQCSHAAGLLHW
ncbi:hypothetical protein AQF52_0118 [Streptomyces venezuelae]|nr:hypothetical protein AQF52_0118 [Streptomyces venezuelae]CUM44095.1 hypothetical protein BN2537_17155 [Streptomyces venezuelae]